MLKKISATHTGIKLLFLYMKNVVEFELNEINEKYKSTD